MADESSFNFTAEDAAELKALRRDFGARSDVRAALVAARLRLMLALEEKERLARAALDSRLNLWKLETSACQIICAHLGSGLKGATGNEVRVWRPGSVACVPDLVFRSSADGKTWICTFVREVADGT